VPELSNIFFDLDGTLIDPKEGISKSFQYSLSKLGCSYPGDLRPEDIIGPPLRATFAKLLGSDEKPLIEKAVSLYRERYSETGIFENTLYPGIEDLLSTLNRNSLGLFMVTTKPTVYAKRIADHFSFTHWFKDIFGTGLDGRFDDKAEHVGYILGHLKLVPEETIMIGDRNHDIVAGKLNRTKTAGVTYGYGSEQEINNAVPDFICHSPADIQRVIMRFGKE
jgi:phosphoglycolate phosphatase